MARKKDASGEFAFLSRKQIASLFRIPLRLVDRWIATGQITAMRVSVLGRGGQRVFYSAADAKKLSLVTPKHKRKRPTRRQAGSA
jgi:hypothetical protein